MSTPKKPVILYTSEACSLCERALEQIDLSEAMDNHSFSEVDIATDVELLRRFGNHIPVLSMINTDALLYWPFDYHDINQWLLSLDN